MLSFFVYFDFNPKLVNLLLWKNWYTYSEFGIGCYIFCILFIFRTKFLGEHRKIHLDAKGNLPCPQCEDKSCPNYTEMAKHIHNMGPTAYIWAQIMDKVHVFVIFLCNLGNFCRYIADRADFLFVSKLLFPCSSKNFQIVWTYRRTG